MIAPSVRPHRRPLTRSSGTGLLLMLSSCGAPADADSGTSSAGGTSAATIATHGAGAQTTTASTSGSSASSTSAGGASNGATTAAATAGPSTTSSSSTSGNTTTNGGSGGATNGGATNGGDTSAGTEGGSGGGDPGECQAGSSATEWAASCPTSAPSCTSGTWIAGGPDPDHQNFTLKAESAHFAVYSDEDISTASAQAATEYLEEVVWPTYFGAPIYFREPLCDQTTKYKASIHVHSDWGLTGGAWSSTRMGMWIGTGALNDHWGLAHEFTHAVQSVSGGQRCDESNTCGWVYESHANFMPHQLEEYRGDVHCSELSVNMPHLYLGSTRDRYCNWQFMEFLKDKHCYSAVNAIWTGAPAPDPFTAIMNGMGWEVAQLNDFIGEWAMHNVTWDYENPPPTAGGNQGPTYRNRYGSITDTSRTERRRRLTELEPLDADFATHRRFMVPFHWAPQRFGYNVIRLYPEAGASSVRVTFRGVVESVGDPDWRWGLVATDGAITTARYSTLQRGADGELRFCVDPTEPLFLVVAATPATLQTIVWDQPYNTVPRYPYLLELEGAWPAGFQNGVRDACPSGLERAANGGGCAPSGVTAYVGPFATVDSGATVSGDARIEDHAIVARGSVSGGVVGSLTLLGSNDTAFTMSGGTAQTTFYPLGYFEGNQGLAGGTLIGDVEYRGAGLSRSSGTCSGFVDASTCVAPGTDATPRPPYTWRE